MANEPIYVPINSSSLPHYFGRGCILPVKYLSNKVEDIQNIQEDAILLSKKKWVKNADCSLEVVLTEEEEKGLIGLSDNFYKCNAPIPTSRIKGVYFLDTKQKETTVWNVNNGAAFIPDHLLQVENRSELDVITVDELSNLSNTSSAIDLTNKIKSFDHILGGFAFMRLGNRPETNYPDNYFSTLSYFNRLIEEECKKAANEKELLFNYNFWGIFSFKNESTWSKWLKYIYQNVETNDVEKLALSEGINLQSKYGLLKLDAIDKGSVLYDIALLATYGDRKNKSVDDLVTDLADSNIVPTEKKEEVSLLFGLNNGYSKLRNRYKNRNGEKIVKFKLESKLDYYIIESIYQFVFNGNKENFAFPYIDAWCPTLTESIKGQETYKILDTTVIAKKKPLFLSLQYLENLFQKFSANEIFTTIVKVLNQWLPPFAKIKEEDGIKYFEEALKKSFTQWSKSIFNQVRLDYNKSITFEKEQLVQNFELERMQLNTEINNLREQLEKAQVYKSASHPVNELNTKDTQSIKAAENVKEERRNNNPVDSSGDIDLLDIKVLKKIAKEKGIKPLPSKREELIKAIKSIQTFI